MTTGPLRNRQLIMIGAVTALLLLVVLLMLVQHRWLLQTLARMQDQDRQFQLELNRQHIELLQSVERSRRYSVGFAVRQQHYSRFMGLLSDAYGDVVQKRSDPFIERLHQLEKEFYALEPFLLSGERHLVWKQLKAYGKLGIKLLENGEDNGLQLQDKRSLNDMMDSFRAMLYPALFEPEGTHDATMYNTPGGEAQ